MKTDLTRLLTRAENDDLRAELLALLRLQAVAYTQGDSDSLPAEVMLELLASLLYTLGVDPAQPQTLAPLYGRDLRPLYEAGCRALLRKTEQARALIQALCRETPPLGCLSLSDTVRSILASLDHYDARFFAHRVPGEIDYQLIDPVPESVQGIDYILLYLSRLRAEMRFLGRFPQHRLLALLDGTNPSWREEIVSLCLSVGANALGLVLLGEDPRRLHIRESERQALLQLFSPLHPLDIENRLARACGSLLDTLDLREAQDADMMRALCRDLAPRIRSAADAGDLSHVFGGFGVPVKAYSPG
ncbi:MAG: hypothetical protein J6M56_08195 [Clostridia bacterium]|nr:hypothetical protein [Clostridia bacterium]